MQSPITAGDLCEVVGGVLGDNSPNLGLIVKVLRYVGDDPAFGRIWRCEADYAMRWEHHPDARPKHPNTATPGTTDFAQTWLKKIEPPTQTKGTQVIRTKETQS